MSGTGVAADGDLAARLRIGRTAMVIDALEAVALRAFAERGFDRVTVEEIATEATVSVRTFYRYFPAKEDLLQVSIDRRTEAVRSALARRPTTEGPLVSLRTALVEVVAAEDAELRRLWVSVVAATPSVLRGVIGGIQLKKQVMITEFLAGRLEVPDDDPVPTMLAAAVGGIIQGAHIRWFVEGGDLAERIADGLELLERGVGSELAAGPVARSRR